VVKELCYNPEVAVSTPEEVNEFFNLSNPSGHSSPWFTQSLTELSTIIIKIIFMGSKLQPVSWVDNCAAICEQIV
jgi:hypothetical protein